MVDSHQAIYESIVQAGHLKGDAVYVFEKFGGEKTICRAKDLFENIAAFEKEALKNIKKGDRVLDIGAGGGRISFYLQEKGYDITALEKSKLICRVLKERRMKKIINIDIFEYFPRKKYDTALIVNVFSIFGEEKENIAKLFAHVAQKVLKKFGKLIFISVDTKSGKTEFLKRRFIFDKKIGKWLKSFYSSSKEIMQEAKKNGFFLKKYKKNKKRQYCLILKRL